MTGAHGRKRRIERTEGSIRIDYEDDDEEEDELGELGSPGVSPPGRPKKAPKCSNANIDGRFLRFPKCANRRNVIGD